MRKDMKLNQGEGKMVRPNIKELKARGDVEGLIGALEDSDAGVRWKAAYALGEIGDERAIEPLIEALKDSDEYVRGGAAHALGKIGDKRAVEPLIEALKDSDEYVRKGAAHALGKIAINEAQSLLQQAKEFGYCDTSEAEELLNKARTEFEDGNYAQAISDARKSEEIAREIKEESKPEIEVVLPEKTFKPNYWKRLNLIVRNKGNAHAKAVKMEFSKEVEVKGLKELNINSGEEEKLSIILKPKELGDVPLEIKTTYKDADGKEYSAENLFMLNVTEKPAEEPSRRVEEIPTEKEEITIERAIYDPCKRDFIEGALPRMKEWINRYDPGAYWFVISIQNNTDRAIEEWGVELETSAALKIKEAKIEGIEIEIPYEAHLNSFKISVPKEYGIVIPKGGAQRVYFKLRADKPKTVYEISGVFKSAIGEVPIRAKEFKYLCDVGVSPEAVKAELKKTFSEKDAARLALSFKIVQEIDRLCNTGAKTEEYLDRLSVLRNYTEGFSDKFTTQVEEFARFMKQEQLEYLDEEYKVRVRRFCTNLVDVWISEFLKG